MNRTELINYLIEKYYLDRYLEIGVNTSAQPGYNWDGVNCNIKHGVDPNVDTTFRLSSDDFFTGNTMDYDIVFVDGLHLCENAFQDMINARNCGASFIVVHDCNPTTEITQRRIRASDAWHGDVWKAVIKYRQCFSNDLVVTVDTDEGCAVIKPEDVNHYKFKEMKFRGVAEQLTFDDIERNRESLLNLISIEEFNRWF